MQKNNNFTIIIKNIFFFLFFLFDFIMSKRKNCYQTRMENLKKARDQKNKEIYVPINESENRICSAGET